MKIALAGNPNCGKTTLYNLLTGSNEKIGNYSGITVEKKENKIKSQYLNKNTKDIFIVDLPGAYSIDPFTKEESITKDYILNENIDVIINIVDGANIERSLFFTTQLLELNIPTIIAVNKQDIIEKKQTQLDLNKLSEYFNIPTFTITASNGNNVNEVINESINVYSKKILPNFNKSFNDDIDNKDRLNYINQIVNSCVINKEQTNLTTFSDKIDAIVAHNIFGLPIFFVVMSLVFWISQVLIGGTLSEYLNETLFGEIVPDLVSNFLISISVNGFLHDFIIEGIIAGVGAVIGFLPLIMVLFFCLALLEDCGYLSRVALVMNVYFKKIGLSGKSIIPMIIGSGCSIPGIMSTRTIESEKERKITAILTPFVPCGAKLPIIALFSAVFFPSNPFIGPIFYFIAMFMIVIGALILQKTLDFKSEDSSGFILELPEYKFPSISYGTNQMFDKAKAFIIRASTVILLMNTFIWLLQGYNFSFQAVDDQSNSMLAFFGNLIVPIFIPLGFVSWQLAVATITGFIAKEEVVATLAVVLAGSSEEALVSGTSALTEFFNPVTAFAFVTLNLFIPPCFAAIATMRAELDNKKLLFKALFFQVSVGYILAMLITQIGTIIFYSQITGIGFFISLIILFLAALYLMHIFKKE